MSMIAIALILLIFPKTRDIGKTILKVAGYFYLAILIFGLLITTFSNGQERQNELKKNTALANPTSTKTATDTFIMPEYYYATNTPKPYRTPTKIVNKPLEYKRSGYTEQELKDAGYTGKRQPDGSTTYSGFYQAPNKNYFAIGNTLPEIGASKEKIMPKSTSVKASCNPNYAGACVPNVSYDIDCSSVNAKSFRVVGVDVYGFDADGDGIACEPYVEY